MLVLNAYALAIAAIAYSVKNLVSVSEKAIISGLDAAARLLAATSCTTTGWLLEFRDRYGDRAESVLQWFFKADQG
ncbi:MAG: hypothetical protein E4H20_02005 [Spirochaetales bacterium]|nr:MAG: hypothetical protein E4H20_02005 [Spirochaetales bacterium]